MLGAGGVQGQLMPVADLNWLYPLRCLSHAIDETSPLHGKSPGDIQAEDGYISVLICGVDDHFCEVRLVFID